MGRFCAQHLSAALLLALAAGSAHAGLFDDDEARKQIAQLKAESEARQQNAQKALEERIARLETTVRNRSLDMAQTIEQLRQEIAKLRGRIQVLNHNSELMERRQKDLYVDLDTRLRKLDKQFQDKVMAPELEAKKEQDAYDAALNQFKVGNYQACIAAFQTFVANHPKSKLVPAAQYWIGNAYYAARDFKVAIATQQKLVDSWPDSAKAPDAMLNIASAQAELGEQRSARETLYKLIKKYPSSSAAKEAKHRLHRR